MRTDFQYSFTRWFVTKTTYVHIIEISRKMTKILLAYYWEEYEEAKLLDRTVSRMMSQPGLQMASHDLGLNSWPPKSWSFHFRSPASVVFKKRLHLTCRPFCTNIHRNPFSRFQYIYLFIIYRSPLHGSNNMKKKKYIQISYSQFW